MKAIKDIGREGNRMTVMNSKIEFAGIGQLSPIIVMKNIKEF